MLTSLVFAFVCASVAHAATFNVTVGANGNLAYNPPFVQAQPGDLISFQFHPKNHTLTQSSFDEPCSQLPGGTDSGFMPVAQETGDLPTFQVEVSSVGSLYFYCKQSVGNHCGHGMVFAINPPDQATFDDFQARANATLNSTTTTTSTTAAVTEFSTPPPQSWQTATATVTNGTSVWTSTYTSYLGSLPPSPAPQPVTHEVTVGANGMLAFSPSSITALVGDSIEFTFYPKNHSVTQSTFSNPCVPIEQTTGTKGFDSGFQPVDQDAVDHPTFSIIVEDTAPIWIFCEQTGHCGSGMVFAANAVETGPNNFENFLKLAKRINGTSTASASAPAATGNSSNRGSALSSSPALIVTVGLLVLGLIWA